MLIPVVILFLYLSVIVFKFIKNSDNNHKVPLSVKLLDPIVELTFLLPWGVFRKMELLQKLLVRRSPVFKVRDIFISREDGTKLKLRVYHPRDAENLPVIVYFHGGGFAVGSIETVDKSMAEMCSRIGCVVVSVDYRLAPEFPYPHGFDDAYFSTKWVFNNARELKINPDQIVVMGDSAGGNFAAGVSLQNSHNGGRDFRLAHQVLIYPSTDLRASSTRPSKIQFHYGWFYSTRHSQKFRVAYMTNYQKDSQEYQASPCAYDGDMSHVPGAFILVAQVDPLRDEGIAYATKLKESNIDVKVNTYVATHGFFAMKMKEATRAQDDIVRHLRKVFFGEQI